MEISLSFLAGHCLCSIALAVCAWSWKINKRWVCLFTFLFFISEPAVFLIWGPFRFYGLYAAAFFVFLFLAKATERFYIFLKTQEAAVRFLFWAAVVVFCGAVVLTSISEINLRRDALTFWTYESKRHPDALSMNNLADAYDRAKDLDKAQEYYQKAAQADPKSVRAYEGRRVWPKKQAVGPSDGGFSKVIALNPQLPQAYLGLGEAFRLLGESSRAVETYSRLLGLFPDDEKIDVKVIEAYGSCHCGQSSGTIFIRKSVRRCWLILSNCPNARIIMPLIIIILVFCMSRLAAKRRPCVFIPRLCK